MEQWPAFQPKPSHAMPYLLLIQEPVGQRAERGETAGREVYQRMLDYTEALRARGVLMASSALAHVREGQSLRLRDGRRHVVDGPFAETKEMVGGFFLLDVASRDEALALAAECPAAQWATVEVRETGPCYLSR
jgi:hypothetical protein